MSLRNGLLKTILPLKLLYWIKVLSLRKMLTLFPGERLKALFSEHLKKWPESSPVSLRNSIFKTIFPLKLCIDSKLCLLGEWLNSLPPQGLHKWNRSSPASSRKGLFKTILPLKLSHQLKALSPGRIAWSSVSLRPEQWLCRMRLPQCHWWTAFSRPPSH